MKQIYTTPQLVCEELTKSDVLCGSEDRLDTENVQYDLFRSIGEFVLGQ